MNPFQAINQPSSRSINYYVNIMGMISICCIFFLRVIVVLWIFNLHLPAKDIRVRPSDAVSSSIYLFNRSIFV